MSRNNDLLQENLNVENLNSCLREIINFIKYLIELEKYLIFFNNVFDFQKTFYLNTDLYSWLNRSSVVSDMNKHSTNTAFLPSDINQIFSVICK